MAYAIVYYNNKMAALFYAQFTRQVVVRVLFFHAKSSKNVVLVCISGLNNQKCFCTL